MTDSLQALLGDLSEEQRRAVLEPASSLVVIAGAGAGKTNVLTRRVARRILDGTASADAVLVVTFTRRAAGELRHRLRRLGVGDRVVAGTFHAVALEELRRHWQDRNVAPPTVLDDPARLLRRLLEPADAGEVRAAAGEIDWARARLVHPDEHRAAAHRHGRRTEVAGHDIGELHHRYVEALRRAGSVDLTDVVVRCAEVLEDDPRQASAWRWRHRHFFVDEFQDVNPAQWRLLQAWLGDRDDLFAVGDPRQAIYAWNGSDPELLTRLPELLAGTVVLRLDDNHRSTPQVLAAANAVLPADQTPSVSLVADGPEPIVSGYDDEDEEARAVVRWLRLAHHPGRCWSHLAVLARTNARLETVTAALEAARIPVRRHSGSRAAAALRSAVTDMRRNGPDRLLRHALEDLATSTGTAAGIEEAVHGVLSRLADELCADAPDPTVATFLAWMAASGGVRAAAEELEGPADAVDVVTFHRAKGLEWPAVAVVGLEDGTVPLARAGDPAAQAEERRLMYVALTRAEREVHCSWAARRRFGDSWRPARPSPFLAEIIAARQPDSAGEPDVLSARLAALRSRLPTAS